MAVVNENSNLYANQVATGAQTFSHPSSLHGRKRIAWFDYTRTTVGDASSLVNLVKLPPGRVRVFLNETVFSSSALGAARTMDTGWLAYNDPDGAAVAADPNGLDDGVDVSSAAVFSPTGTVGGEETYLFQSRDGVTLTAQVNDGTWPAAATLQGYVTYVVD